MKTILITGCSSGFGNEMAKYFLERDWRVIATMRTPRADVLPVSENLQILPLDVTDAESIRKAVEAAGEIDALVNNAGIGLFSAVESTALENIREIIETNTIGTIAMIQAVLPQFRKRKTGAIVNITSSVTYKPLPLLSIYRASKAAINAFSESLAVELEPLNVRVRVVLPGRAPETSFAENAQQSRMPAIPEAYSEMVKGFMDMLQSDDPVTYSSDISEAVWNAINDSSSPIIIPAGVDAVEWSKSS